MAAATLPAYQEALDALSRFYRYPAAGTTGPARGLQAAVAAFDLRAAGHLDRLVDLLDCGDSVPGEELFVGTFELNPVCALEVGWQVYGEQYARGTFLVKLRELTREAGLEAPTELPDHLSNVLLVIGRVPEDTAHKLAVTFTLPALARMAEKLPADDANPYGGLLAATTRILERAFGAEVSRE